MSEKNINNIDQIRDLIFGSQIKEFEEKFNKFEISLQSMEAKIHNIFERSYEKIQRETERSLEALEKKIDNLSVVTQKERLKLKELIDTTDDTLHTQLENQKDELLAKMKVMKENLSDENIKIKENMKVLRSEIEKVLRDEIGGISDDKLSKDAMAQMFLEIAMKIHGTDMNMLISEGKSPEK